MNPAHLTDRMLEVAALFDLDLSTNSTNLTNPANFAIPSLSPGTLLLLTGDSGSGKSTLLRTLELHLHQTGRPTLRLDAIPLDPARALVDCFPGPLPETLAHLARAGLSDAHLLLRTPRQLSEGQQFRYRLAQFFASTIPILIADEFAATLDRLTAQVLAWQLQKFIRQSLHSPTPRTALLATSHTDLTPDLHPHTHLRLPINHGSPN